MKFKRVLICILVVGMFIGLQAGCAVKDNGQPAASDAAQSGTTPAPAQNDADKQKKVMEEFDALVQKNAELKEAVAFVDSNISKVSVEDGSKMVITLEKLQKAGMPKLEERFYSGETVQIALVEAFKAGQDINKLEGIKDEKVNALLKETRDSNFKIETAEGMFFPIINYGSYRKYSSYVTPDIKEYIELMAVESDNVPAKDAGLVISWEDVLKRAQNQERFIDNYSSSEKISDVKQLYKNYVTFALYGANNTPVFDYDTKTVVQEAKESYEKFLKSADNGGFSKLVKDYYEVLKKNNFKLNAEVDKYRKGVEAGL